MLKIKNYLFKTSLKFILINQSIVLFLIVFLNLIELTRTIENEDKNLLNFLYLSFLKIPSIINETSPFVIIISTAFLFRYLITNNELIAMRNICFSIFDIFYPITIGVFVYGIVVLLFFNPLTAISENKYDEFLKNKTENMYSINFSKNSIWIKNKNFDEGLFYININKFNIKNMVAEDIKILSIKNNKNEFIYSKKGNIADKIFKLNDVSYFNIDSNEYNYKKNLNLEINFSKDNILSSVVNYKNVPFYSYLNHIETLKKFSLYSSTVSLYYLSEILKPFFLILLSFVVMGFSAKYKRNESFFKVLFFAVLFGFIFYILRELINKFTLSFDINFVYSYLIIFIIPFLIGLFKVIQIEND